MVKIAKRINNKKRNYLVINELQGKHIPTSPKKAFEMFDALADMLEKEYETTPLLLVGFAETATAIGARISIRLGSDYIQTTREQIPGAEYLFFTEAHSHATEQKLIRQDVEACLKRAGRIVFIEDEVTTGNTILNIINILEKRYPCGLRFSVASLINGMRPEALEAFSLRDIPVHYLYKTNHESYAQIADSYCADGRCVLPDDREDASVESFELSGCVNARRLTTGGAYETACRKLWEQVREKISLSPPCNVLVVGTEEFMYPALYVGERIEALGCQVKCHATTRSPIAVSADMSYPLHVRYELASLYEDERKTYLYDLRQYDRAIVITDAPKTLKKGENTLIWALKDSGNEKIQLFRWQK